jgi:hypothetical protein
MNHPNTFAAIVAGAVTIGVQWLVQRYAHVALSDYWKTAVTASAMAGVLYVGRNGVKAALLRLLSGPKKAWAGVPAPAPSPGPAPEDEAAPAA